MPLDSMRHQQISGEVLGALLIDAFDHFALGSGPGTPGGGWAVEAVGPVVEDFFIIRIRSFAREGKIWYFFGAGAFVGVSVRMEHHGADWEVHLAGLLSSKFCIRYL